MEGPAARVRVHLRPAVQPDTTQLAVSDICHSRVFLSALTHARLIKLEWNPHLRSPGTIEDRRMWSPLLENARPLGVAGSIACRARREGRLHGIVCSARRCCAEGGIWCAGCRWLLIDSHAAVRCVDRISARSGVAIGVAVDCRSVASPHTSELSDALILPG